MAEAKGCDTCAHKLNESEDEQGERIVECDINKYQMYSPLVDECKHYQAEVSL